MIPAKTLRFGKHRGKQINAVPAEYIYWLVAQNWLRHKWPDLHSDVRNLAIRHLEAEREAERQAYLCRDLV